MSPTQIRLGTVGAGRASGWGQGADRVEIGGAGQERARLLGPQVVGMTHPAGAPAAHRMALDLHFGAEPARAAALAMVRKRFAHGQLSGRLECLMLRVALPAVKHSQRYAQHPAELTYGQRACPLGDLPVGVHWVGWPEMTKAFF